MNTYYVYLRKGGAVRVSAAGYTESKRSQRVYFYTDAARKDRQTWFSIRDIEGIHASDPPKDTLPSVEEYKQYVEALLPGAAAQASNSQH